MTDIPDPITVLIADDHPSTRAGLCAILNDSPGIKVVGEAEDGFQVEKLVSELRPNILLLDLVMPGPTPAQLEKWVRTNYPETITLVLTAHDRDAYLAGMIDAGAAGFLSKSETGDRITSAIRRAVNGENLITKEQHTRAEQWRNMAGDKWEDLSRRERVVVRLLVNGCDNKQIAERLGIAVKTASFHVGNILEKLDVKSRHEAVAWVRKYLPDNLE